MAAGAAAFYVAAIFDAGVAETAAFARLVAALNVALRRLVGRVILVGAAGRVYNVFNVIFIITILVLISFILRIHSFNRFG